jgi:hypothetical protein
MLGASEARAETCDAAEAEARATRIRTHLQREKRRARTWDLSWGAGLAVVSIGQGVMALTDTMPIGDYTDATEASLWVGAGKSAIGSAARFVLRLKIVDPGAPSGDACADADAAERALRESGKHERTTFFLNHLGGLALNVAGALYLGLEEDAWSEAALSTALGYPVALAIAYTQPRDSWHAWRSGSLSASDRDGSVSVSIGPVRSRAFTGLIVSGAF